MHWAAVCNGGGKNRAINPFTKVTVYTVLIPEVRFFCMPVKFNRTYNDFFQRFNFSVDKSHRVEKMLAAVMKTRTGIKLFASPR